MLTECDFLRISQKYIKEREKLNKKKSELMDNFQILQEQQLDKNKNQDNKMNYLMSEFLEMKEIDKSYLFRLVDKIEIDKDKNVLITFNFAPLNTISENIDAFVPIEQILEDTKM